MSSRNVPPPDQHRDQPLQQESRRTFAAGLASELALVAISYFVGGSFFPFLAGTFAVVLFVYAIRPGAFQRHIEARIIEGTPYRRETSIWKWAAAILGCLVISAVGSLVYRHYIPDRPNALVAMVKTILSTINDVKKEEELRNNPLAPTNQNGRSIAASPRHSVRHSPPSPNAPPPNAPVGNLGMRAIELANAIDQDLARCGFRQSKASQDAAGISRLVRTCSNLFRSGNLQRVVAIRGEFADLHFRDPDLDQILDSIDRMFGGYKPNSENYKMNILPQEIEMISSSLRTLAAEVEHTNAASQR